ncbi:gliding motility-associated C-terminal domain-containing protein [Roseivirga sp. 4D4]|uniref:T9SS type B sorting domain-containing protein n=1 Tax=Roseivirga sp. 4D4 TaxID=1889784 RepID=UPI000A9ABF10|nr:gliding motility-associated C-terminal domain-containing protein [Roseivirga sp. 4D4]
MHKRNVSFLALFTWKSFRLVLVMLLWSIVEVVSLAQVTTQGKDFWLGFSENEPTPGLSLEIYINADEQANVTLRTPLGNFFNTKLIEPGKTTLVILPDELMADGVGKNNHGVHITSDKDISVHVLNKVIRGADASVIIPTRALDTDYYVMAHVKSDTLDNDARESNLLIVATEDSTQVEIIPSVDTFQGWRPGQSNIITLDAGQTYQVKSRGDLTGTLVRSIIEAGIVCKKIAVFSGNKSTNISGCGETKDHLVEQMFPISTWGDDFLYVPFQDRTSGDLVKILASVDGTTVKIDGMSDILLDAGEYEVLDSMYAVSFIDADKPIAIGQFSKSEGCDGVPSDPLMIMVSPLQQGIQQVTFNSMPLFNSLTYHLTVVTRKEDLNNIILDNVDITDQFEVVGEAAYATIVFTQGNHTISSPGGVIPYVYAFGQEESYGYMAGSSLSRILNERIRESVELISLDAICIESSLDMRVEFEMLPGTDPVFDTFFWDFGDGTTLLGEEGALQQVTHKYDAPGEYEVIMVASDGGSLCNNAVVIRKTVSVTEFAVNEVSGPVSVCPDIKGIEYAITGTNHESYQWFINGGVIVSDDTAPTVTVEWGGISNEAFIKVLPVTASNQCAIDTITVAVTIDNLLEPDKPMSSGPVDDQVCADANRPITYFTPQASGSQYEWFVNDKGQFVGSNTGNSVEIVWNEEGIGQVWFREFNPQSPGCEGFSEVLDVTINPPLTVDATLVPPVCRGEANGRINLNVTGSNGSPLDIVWDNGMTGANIGNLAAGDYTATVTDEIGCVNVSTFTLVDPEELVATLEVEGTRCNGSSDGLANVLIEGGVAPYQVFLDGGNIDLGNSISGLSVGAHKVQIRDSAGCEIEVDFDVSEPEPLTAITTDDPTCPNIPSGSIFVEAQGGTRPYTYRWNTSPPQDAQLIQGLSAGTYSVTVTDANGCTFTFPNEEISERYPRISVPNAFSPNGDGRNDTFHVVYDCATSFQMKVYSEWGGEVLFSTNDITEGWDGTFRGQKVQSGAYSYVLSYWGEVNGFPFEEIVRGTVKLIR